MKKNNSLGKVSFVLEHFFWILVSWIWYKNILFRCLDSHSFMESKLILCGILSVSCIAGILLEMKNDRNGTSIFFNVILGFGIYTVLTFIQIRRMFIIVCLSIVGTLSIMYSILIMCRKIKDKKRTGRILRRRVIRTISVAQKFLGVGLALIMIVFGVNIFFGSTIMKSKVSIETQADISNQSIANNMEKLVLLQDNIWGSLTVQERLDVLQTVANIEQRYLGIPNELNVGAANLNDGVLGYYSDKTHEVVIDVDSLLYSTSWEVLDSVCHEAYHSYQYRIVEAFNEANEDIKNLKIFRKANSYAREFENYVSGTEDFCSYYDQNCESDARDYAEDAVYDYYLKINKYLLDQAE